MNAIVKPENDLLHGIAYGLSAETYFAQPHLSNSALKELAKSPAHYQYWLSAQREQTKAMQLGSAVHCAVLEPKEFDKRYLCIPSGIDKRTKEGKTLWDKFQKDGRELLSLEDFNLVKQISDVVHSHPTCRELLEEGKPEVSAFTNLYDAPVKIRPDWLRSDGIVVDLKTAQSASPGEFARSIANFRYHVQAALYRDALESLELPIFAFIFIAVEKEPPYGIGVYELDDEALELGRNIYQRGISLWKHCTAFDSWPGYDERIFKLSIPAWAYSQAER